MAREKPPESVQLPDNLRLGRNTRSRWRLGAWGAAAALSLAIAALVAQSGPGKARLQQIFDGIVPMAARANLSSASAQPAEPKKPRITAEQTEIRDMTERMRSLTSDHDRLERRIATLERRLETVTGAIEHQPAPAPKEEAAPSPGMAKPGASSAPAAEPPRTLPQAQTASAPKQTGAVPASRSVASAAPVHIAPTADAPPKQANEQGAPAENTAIEDIKLPALVRLPPRRAPMHRAASPASFGVDLGTAASVDEVKAQWAAIKANFGPRLTGLDSIPTRDSRPGQGPYRLVIGPLPNMAAAHRLCAQFAVGHVACKPVELAGRHVVQR